jgi:hypothetical protein
MKAEANSIVYFNRQYAPLREARVQLVVVSQKFITELRKGKSRFFAHHPQTEKRLGPRSLRMTAFVI